MERRKFIKTAALAAAAGALVAGCGNGGASSERADIREIRIQPEGNQLQYAQTEFTVQAGETVTVVFENTATSPAMQHNVVILNTDDDEVVERVGRAALRATSSNYIPDDAAILAQTAISQPGETVRVTFTAPTLPGTYRYLCTYPGHYAVMQGQMIVQG